MINGRFLGRPATGVDRVAIELTRAIAQISKAEGRVQPLVLSPSAVRQSDEISGVSIRKVGHWAGAQGTLWEQMVLPWSNRSSVLLSLCNSGPIFRRRQALMIHDAQVHLSPKSYSLPFRLWYKLMQPRLAKQAAHVFAVSEFSKRQLEQYGVVPVGKTKVVPNGADHILRIPPDPTALTRLGLKPRGFLFALASDHHHKNVQLLRSLNTGLPLVLAGGRRTDCQGNVTCLGRVSERTLRTLYDNAFAFLFPSVTEGFGLPPLEAMLCGTPVIASTGGALPETCGNGALFADPFDPTQWDDAIRELQTSSVFWAQRAEMGQNHAATFTWERSAKLLLHHLSAADQPMV